MVDDKYTRWLKIFPPGDANETFALHVLHYLMTDDRVFDAHPCSPPQIDGYSKPVLQFLHTIRSSLLLREEGDDEVPVSLPPAEHAAALAAAFHDIDMRALGDRLAEFWSALPSSNQSDSISPRNEIERALDDMRQAVWQSERELFNSLASYLVRHKREFVHQLPSLDGVYAHHGH